jgi:hypothetical protein
LNFGTQFGTQISREQDEFSLALRNLQGYKNLRLRTNMSLGVLAVVIQLRFNKFTASNRYTRYEGTVVELPECEPDISSTEEGRWGCSSMSQFSD